MGGYNGILGPLLLSIFINTYASGLVGVQYALFQALKYKKSVTIRLMVLSIYGIDVFQIVVAFYMIWIYCVTNYVDPTALDRGALPSNFFSPVQFYPIHLVMTVALWVFTSIPLCSAVSSLIVHVFMTYRISLFTERRALVAALAVFSLAVGILGLGAGSYGIVRNISMMDVVAGPSSYRTLLTTWFAARLALDFVLLGALLYIYFVQDTTFLNHIQIPIIRFGLITLQCGFLTTIFSICTLITFIASPKATIYLVFLLPSGRLYSCVLLTTLNSIHPKVDPRANNTDILSKDMWAVQRSTRNSYTQGISLPEIRTEPEDATGSQTGDARSVSSHISITGTRNRDDKKTELIQSSHDDRNLE
ncbi:hypothetical protein BDN70DRAFT_996531 [Pholiota conissans]|uniref:Uncharacterized protein n=1 Tax=Pholiota conissans TaxID=109636 RepID=A0A9P6CPZ9_9AGAR|nr:hypothetical protein BDN70DRAFT_996531 [Pholiota conissans]